MSTNTNFAQNRIGMEPYWVEYLESVYNTSNSPIIDTGIPIGNIGAVHCTFSHSEHLSTSDNCGFGTTDMFFFGGKKNSNDNFVVLPYMGSAKNATITYSTTTDRIYSLYSVSQKSGSSITNNIYFTKGYGLDDNNTLIINDTHTNASIDLTTTFSLFRCKNGNPNKGMFCRIYSCHIFDTDGNLLSWLRPCLHPRTLKPSFYDLVRHRYLYSSDSNGELAYGHNFIPSHYIRLTNSAVPEFKIWGVDTSNRGLATLYSISPNPNVSRMDMAVRMKAGQNKTIIQYPSQGSNSMVINGNVQGYGVIINLAQSNGGGTAPASFSHNTTGQMANLIVRNDLTGSNSYFVDNGITHTGKSDFLIDVNEGGYPVIGGTQRTIDIASFSMRYTTPTTAVSGIQPFGFYYDFIPCRLITEEKDYGKSAFFDYVNAQYIVSTSESSMTACEGMCTLIVNDTANEATVQAVAWQYNTP